MPLHPTSPRCMGLSGGLLPSGFPTKALCASLLTHTCYMFCPSQSLWFTGLFWVKHFCQHASKSQPLTHLIAHGCATFELLCPVYTPVIWQVFCVQLFCLWLLLRRNVPFMCDCECTVQWKVPGTFHHDGPLTRWYPRRGNVNVQTQSLLAVLWRMVQSLANAV